jgi:hypothetical protein
MKKFIIISLLSAFVMPALACGGWGTDNYYLFSPYFATSFKSRVEKTCNDNSLFSYEALCNLLDFV